MYIPPTSRLGYETFADNPLKSEKWSSLIGIVTAICGNILISFALNTQRYAHMRLNSDREEWELKQRRRKRQNRKTASYGTQQVEIAEERLDANLNSEPTKYPLQEPQDDTETDPLIPSVEALNSKKRSGSSGQIRGTRDDEDSPKEKSYLKSKIWWLGISMMTVGEAGNFLAYGFAPASIVSPLGVVALISNCLIAPWLLHERFRWRDGLGVVIAVAGCVTVVLSASDSNPRLTPDSIWHLITRWEFETYLGITVVVILVLCYASEKFGDKSILIDLGLMGLFGGYTALSTKGVASLLSNTVWRVITFPITYLLVAVLVVSAVMQIKYINRALQRFDSTQVIPIQFVLFTLSVIVGSAILYRDFERTSTEDAIKFIAGCALTFFGVWCITSGRDQNQETDEEMGEEDDAVDLLDEEGVQPEIRERDDNDGRRPSLLPRPKERTISSGGSTSSLASDSDGSSLDQEFATPRSTSRATELSPAKTAAIHPQSAADLPLRDQDDIAQRPPMHATTSLPEVFTTDFSTPSRPKTPLRRGLTGPSGDSPSKAGPSTPTARHTPADQHPDQTGSHRLLNRHSVAGLLPGPFTSPLSSSLSAIVADSLRRGLDRQPSSVRRRSRLRGTQGLGSKRMSQPDAAPQKRHSIASGEMAFGHDGSFEQQNSPSRPSGRIRSLSAAIGDMFGPSRSSRLEARENEPETPREGDRDDQR